MRHLNAFINHLIALIPEGREAFYARVNQACIDALNERRTEPLEGAPQYALCYQGGVPCPTAEHCPALLVRW
jgi:hypothetical protein